jgi:hypothetical protein
MYLGVAVKYKTCDNRLMNASTPAPAAPAQTRRTKAQTSVPAAAPPSPAVTAKLHHDALPKLELAPGTRVAVNFNPLGSGGTPVQGEFLGTRHYEFLIIRLPGIPGLRKLKAGDGLVLLTAFTWDKPAVKGAGIVRSVETAGARMILGLSFGEAGGEFVDALARCLFLISVLNRQRQFRLFPSKFQQGGMNVWKQCV